MSTLLPGSDYVLGEVSIPLRSIVRQASMDQWFVVSETGSKYPTAIDESSSPDVAKIHVKLKWEPPKHNVDDATPVEREASIVIQEELIRSTLIHGQKHGFLSLLSTSVGALNSIRSTSGSISTIQKSLGAFTDLIESTRHAIIFTVRRRYLGHSRQRIQTYLLTLVYTRILSNLRSSWLLLWQCG